jgi:cytochrome c-type biogenesis protein CcmH
MMLWAIFAILCIAVVGILVFPLWRGRKDAPPRAEYDFVVYRSQLAEIDEEIANGLLTADQAEGARAEVYRRMLAAEDAELKMPLRAKRGSRIVRIAAIAAVALVVPVGAAILYSVLGSPNLPGKPYDWRIHNDPDFVTAATADKLATMLQASPSAGGYAQLGRMYFLAQQYQQAADADHHAIDLGAKDAAVFSEFGESLVMANNGVVVPDAMRAFVTAIGIEPQSERSRFYLGLSEAQIGNDREAVAIWKDLEKTSDPAAPWLPMVREHIVAFAKQGGFDPASVPPSPPDLKAIETAVQAMTKAMHLTGGMAAEGSSAAPGTPANGTSRDTLVRAMVQQLADRMARTPSDVTGWKRLAHAYVVLGDLPKARAAADKAVQLKPDDVSVQLGLAEVEKAAAPNDEAPKDFVATMRTVLKLDPANPAALYYVGVDEARAGQTAKARAMWTKALGLVQQGDPLADSIKSKLNGAAGKAN